MKFHRLIMGHFKSDKWRNYIASYNYSDRRNRWNWFLALLLIGISGFVFSQNSSVTKHIIDDYTVEVYLPSKYDAKIEYPVVYFNDGQMLFSQYSFLGFQKILDDLINSESIEDLIVVGIHAKSNRSAMYVPYKDSYINQSEYNFQPEAVIYAKDLIEKIIPSIDKKYRTLRTSAGRAIFGFSHGGLNATWLGLNYPEYFSMSAALSPSFWVADYSIFEEARKYKNGTKIWFDIGTQEWNYYVPFIEKIKEQGGVYGTDIFYYEVPYGRHDREFWFNRISNPLIIFNGKRDGELKKWHIETEVIKSQSKKDVYYLRLNPIVSLSNGLTYSLATEATYKLTNDEDGQINRDGSFSFNGTNDLRIEVSYKKFKKTVVVKYNKIAKMKMND